MRAALEFLGSIRTALGSNHREGLGQARNPPQVSTFPQVHLLRPNGMATPTRSYHPHRGISCQPVTTRNSKLGLAQYATVNREWQALVEEQSWATLRIKTWI